MEDATNAIDVPRQIMVVDDTPMNLLVLKQMLKHKLGRNCSTHSSGEEAIVAVEKLVEE